MTASLHFLVVDDDADARAMTVEYLRSMGYEKITQAKDGSEAVWLLDRDPTINFIVSDWQMPNVDGLSLLQQIRSNPARAQMPFLIVTSPVSEEAEKVVLAAENLVNAYLIKPFRGELLKQKIEALLAMSVHGPQKRVVVVDDDSDARQMLVEYLETLGFRDVRPFADGHSALVYLNEDKEHIGLIVSDWEMPEMSGIELLRVCKSQPGLSEIPFLMITSQGSMERMKVMQAARSHVDQYLLKPFSCADFKERVDSLLESYRHRRDTNAWLAEAMEHLEYGRYKAAHDLFQQVLELDPDNERALRGTGDALAKMKGVQAALGYYRKAVEANPISSANTLKLASSYEQMGWVDKAVALLESATKTISFNAELHFHLGRLYNKKGHVDAAKQEFERALEIQLDHREARLMLEMLGLGRTKQGGS